MVLKELLLVQGIHVESQLGKEEFTEMGVSCS